METKIIELIREFLHCCYLLTIPIFFINIAYLVYFTYDKLLKKGKWGSFKQFAGPFLSKKVVIFIIETIFIIGIFVPPYSWLNKGTTTIGSVFEKDYYEEQYYVYIRKNTDSSKSYKVPADIRKGSYEYEDFDENGNSVFYELGEGYFIQKIYWDNGGFLTFPDDFLDGSASCEIYLWEETYCTDINDEGYYITLTNEKAKR